MESGWPQDEPGSYVLERLTLDLGFTFSAALKLVHANCDWHRVEEALDNGCSHELAVRIFS